ncbi:MAG: TaqI-like C-terminal specificity domain-containing protein, partial [Thermotogota bacterium]|nr:TaqI-like C-terminal specificity domain-containing protein [Thermotogota bacterium]
VKALSILTLFFKPEEQESRTEYYLKRQCIENCLYGVDIDPSAVEIAKLRFWLSLIVDEEKKEDIQPLPNLDHKIMCGNSLLEEFEGIKLFDERLLGEVVTKSPTKVEIDGINEQILKLNDELKDIRFGDQRPEIKQKIEQRETLKKRKETLEKRLEKEKRLKDKESQVTIDDALPHRIKESQIKLSKLRKLQKEFFNEQNRNKKKKLREEIDKIEWELVEATLEEQGHEEALAKLEQYKKTNVKPFFLWKLYFAEVFQRDNPGFDVVIANPPYVSAWTMEKEDPAMRGQIKNSLSNYSILKGHWDLYIAFVARGHDLLRISGSLSFIVPNPILREKYAIETRKFLLQNMKLQSILEFNDVNVFEDVARRTSVIVVQNKVNADYSVSILSNEGGNSEFIKEINRVDYKQWLKTKTAQFLIKGTKSQDELIEKLEKQSLRIGNFFYVNYGAQVSSKIKGGFGKKEVVGKEKKGNAKKFIEGKDVHRWNLSYRNLWLDYRYNEIYGPRASELFESPKLIIRKVSDKGHKIVGTYDESKVYTDDGNVLVTPYENVNNCGLLTNFSDYEKMDGNINLKYLLSLLLSKISVLYFKKKFATESLQGLTSHTYPASIRGMILKMISAEQQKPFIDLVDHIFSITKSDDYLDKPDKQAKVKKLEEEIDKLAYMLYELTPEEIKIVEEFNKE